jgi:isopenicillin N synthase-like dioxygenase
MTAVPIIDLAPLRTGSREAMDRVSEQIGRACEEIGFFMVIGHGIRSTVIDQAYASAMAFLTYHWMKNCSRSNLLFI